MRDRSSGYRLKEISAGGFVEEAHRRGLWMLPSGPRTATNGAPHSTIVAEPSTVPL